MIKLIIGKKGSGKTKTLIELVNNALDTSNGSVICIEKGDKLKYDVKYQARLVDTDEYLINDGQSLYGFIAGMLASNHDITDIFIDSAYKICQNSVENLDCFLTQLDKLISTHLINCIMTASVAPEDASETIKKYI